MWRCRTSAGGYGDPRCSAAFAHAVNYHDGLLPAYKGVAATPFSLYHCESESGFTFHHMTEGIDAGPILEQRAVPIDEHSRVAEVDRRKAAAAVAALPRLLDRIAAGDRGRPQTEPGRYFSRADYRTVIEVPRPELVTTVELQRRIRAFGVVLVTIDGVAWPVTRLRGPSRPPALLPQRRRVGRTRRSDPRPPGPLPTHDFAGTSSVATVTVTFSPRPPPMTRSSDQPFFG